MSAVAENVGDWAKSVCSSCNSYCFCCCTMSPRSSALRRISSSNTDDVMCKTTAACVHAWLRLKLPDDHQLMLRVQVQL